MNGKMASALVFASVLFLTASASFASGAKGGGMEETKGTGMMQGTPATGEKQGGTMGTGTMMDDDAKNMQDDKMMPKKEKMVNDDGKMGMEKKEMMDTQGTPEKMPMR